MRHPILAFFAVALVLLSACGREITGTKSNMSEAQAFEQLQNTPMQSTRDAFGRKRPSAEGLVVLLQQLVASGQIKVPSQGKGALNLGNIDISQLLNIFTAISGGAGSIGSLGTALSGTSTGGGLSSIMGLLNAAMPIIAVIAPQYAGIIQALVVILPMVMTFMNMFKKPKPAPTAWNYIMMPARA